MKENKWVRLLAYIIGFVHQELLLQNEYLAAKTRILRVHLEQSPAHLRRKINRKAGIALIYMKDEGSTARGHRNSK